MGLNIRGGETHAYVRMGGRGYENVRSAIREGGQNQPFFAFVIYGWPLTMQEINQLQVGQMNNIYF